MAVVSPCVLRYTPAVLRGQYLADDEITREFPHVGSAVSWARRKLRSGEIIFAELMLPMYPSAVVYEITETGVRRWEQNGSTGDLNPTQKTILMNNW